MKRDIFFSKTPSKSSKNYIFLNFCYIFLLIFVWNLQKIRVSGLRCNLGCAPFDPDWVFFQNFQELFGCFITQLVKMLQQWSLYEVIKDILPFILNIKRPLSDIWLLSYKQNSFGCFLKKLKLRFFSKTPKSLCHLI